MRVVKRKGGDVREEGEKTREGKGGGNDVGRSVK